MRHNAKGERLSIEITTTAGNRVRELVAQVIQSQLRQVGIELRIKAEPPRIFSEGLNRRQFPGLAHVCLGAAPPGRAAHASALRRRSRRPRTPGAARTTRATATPRWTQALDAAERELDYDKRRALFADIQRIHAEDLPVLPLFFRVDPFVIPKQLKGVTPTGHLNSSTLWIEQWRWEN